jgi:hypothetical protein
LNDRNDEGKKIYSVFGEAADEPSFRDRWFTPNQPFLLARTLWLRALGLIFLSAFYSLWVEIHGLIGPRGILPARDYLVMAREAVGWKAYWYIPSLLWLDAGDATLTALVVLGGLASIAIILGVWTRIAIAIAMVTFLSFVAAAQDFSGFQSDGMLLEAAFLSLFLGGKEPPTRAAVFLLQWEWFRIWFLSGLVKVMSGDPQWRTLTAMDEYYENGPLPTWIGWYVQQWPHGFHAFTAGATLVLELLVVWMVFLPSRRARLLLFALTAPLQLGIIATANYAFLNYLVFALGLWLIEDRTRPDAAPHRTSPQQVLLPATFVLSILIFLAPGLAPPMRIVNNYGLFAVMTTDRYELEFQGTRDGRTWVAYPFRYKPQDVMRAPGIYAPRQPRFEWNLWFVALGGATPWLETTQRRLLANEPDVLRLFASNPFATAPPQAVRVFAWQYWFTTAAERRATGAWWKRKPLGVYVPPLTR